MQWGGPLSPGESRTGCLLSELERTYHCQVQGWSDGLIGQVGCPESGIEEAVQRLTAADYKVGRIEQTETAAEAKQKRGNKVSCLAVAAHAGSVIIWVLTTGGLVLRHHCAA